MRRCGARRCCRSRSGAGSGESFCGRPTTRATACEPTSGSRCTARDVPLGLVVGVAVPARGPAAAAVLAGPAGAGHDQRRSVRTGAGARRPRRRGLRVGGPDPDRGRGRTGGGGAVLPGTRCCAPSRSADGPPGRRLRVLRRCSPPCTSRPLQFLGLFVFGLVLGALVRVTGRLGPAIWAHVGFNGATVLAARLELTERLVRPRRPRSRGVHVPESHHRTQKT